MRSVALIKIVGQWWIRKGVLVAVVLCLAACGRTAASDFSTDTQSSQLSTEAEQIAFLGKYVNLKSAVSQTEFHIIYHDNSGGLVPGPSDWDIQAIMLVEDIALWTAGKTQIDTADFTWADSLLTEPLRPASQPTYYTNQTTTLAVFEPEQIIYLRSTTTP
jgi:hypothetical protein